MPAAERGQAGAHRRQVERATDVPRVAQRERHRDFPVVDDVGIPLAARRPARVERRLDLVGVQHPDVRRKERVQRGPQRGGGERRRGDEGDHLAERVDAGVGAARAGHPDRVPDDLLGRVHQTPLDGAGVRLDLPAVVRAAVVREREAQRANDVRRATAGATSGPAGGTA